MFEQSTGDERRVKGDVFPTYQVTPLLRTNLK